MGSDDLPLAERETAIGTERDSEGINDELPLLKAGVGFSSFLILKPGRDDVHRTREGLEEDDERSERADEEGESQVEGENVGIDFKETE